MSARICPTCWAISGKHDGLDFDCISVVPLLEQEKIQIAIITSDKSELRPVAEVAFPKIDQTCERFSQLARQAIGKTLMVLI